MNESTTYLNELDRIKHSSRDFSSTFSMTEELKDQAALEE